MLRRPLARARGLSEREQEATAIGLDAATRGSGGDGRDVGLVERAHHLALRPDALRHLEAQLARHQRRRAAARAGRTGARAAASRSRACRGSPRWSPARPAPSGPGRWRWWRSSCRGPGSRSRPDPCRRARPAPAARRGSPRDLARRRPGLGDRGTPDAVHVDGVGERAADIDSDAQAVSAWCGTGRSG